MSDEPENAELKIISNSRDRGMECLDKINKCFQSFGTDPNENISRLTALAGELMGATCALYNRLEQGLLCSLGQWNSPQDYNPVDKAEGHICYDVIRSGSNRVTLMNNLQETGYARTDPNVAKYKLQTYMGCAVRLGDSYLGSLCVVYQNDFTPGEQDKKLLELIAAAVGVEEKRKSVEKALMESEKRYRRLVESLADYIYTVQVEDGRAVATYHGPGCVNVTGYTSADYEADRYLWYRMAYEGDRGAVIEQAERMLSGESSSPLEHRIIHKDGSIQWVKNTTVPRYDDRGRLVAYDGLITNITRRKRAEEALQESERKYRELFEESKDVISISTPDGRILDFNRAGLELFGYSSKEELLNADIARDLYVHAEDLEGFKRILGQYGFVKDYEATMRKKDGDMLNVLITATAVYDAKGDIVAYRGIIRDITSQKRLEQQLLHAQKMEAIGQLAGGVAHDFNNILTAIIGYANILLMKLGRDDPLKNYVAHILESSEKASSLTKSLLTFGRKQIINMAPVDLDEIVRRVERLLSRLIGEDVELRVSLAGKALTIMADSGQVEQVLMNLATNARDAMPEGGRLTISTELIELDIEFTRRHRYGEPGLYAALSVTDTGGGIDAKTKERIFEPFFTTKEVGKGTGLGLSIVYGIVKQHNGYINVYSELGKGAAFKIYLPLVGSDIGKTEPEAGIIAVKGGDETILVAEDNEKVRGLTKTVLGEFGYTVIEAVDGNDAVRKFMENRDKVQLLLLDVVMPEKNGREAYEEIKAVWPDIKVIFTSGYTADIITRKGVPEGALDFISKPAPPRELLIKVREVLDKQ
ncbi:MAG: PAS domain S-box protein [Nitrospirae bacterium]|nr:PAS domain S-box protein [Nitrospirota bacterium]